MHAIEVLAEVGVVLLLFTIGLEFSLERLRHIFRQVALGGLCRSASPRVTAAGIAVAFGEPIGHGIFYGFVFALSSTAIVLRALGERRELDAPHGRFIVGTLIFQDLLRRADGAGRAAAGRLGARRAAAVGIALALGKAVVVVVGTMGRLPLRRAEGPRLGGREPQPRGVPDGDPRAVHRHRVAHLARGLSLALGAFLGGMVVADTEYGHRAMGDILPLRDAFVSIFFVSLGMLFDVRVVAAQPGLVGLLVLGFLGRPKALLATLAAMAMRFPARVAWLAGVGLAQFGEFGFVLTRLAQSSGVVEERRGGPLIAAGIVSMFLTRCWCASRRTSPPASGCSRPSSGSSACAASTRPTRATRRWRTRGARGLRARRALRREGLMASGTPLVVLELNARTSATARRGASPSTTPTRRAWRRWATRTSPRRGCWCCS
jgi:CPA2 family monovalent cation:H+ antiporter-2